MTGILASYPRSEWREILAGYRGGVDYPVSFFYKEIMTVFPDARVLLNIRDPGRWYESVHGSILQLNTTISRWPCTWFTTILGVRGSMALVDALSRPVPLCSTTGIVCVCCDDTCSLFVAGLGMFGAVEESKETAVRFFEEHVAEVKKVVPEEKLLVWEVRMSSS